MIVLVNVFMNLNILSKLFFFFCLRYYMEHIRHLFCFSVQYSLLILYCIFQLAVDRSKTWKSPVLKWTLVETLKQQQKVLSLDCMNTMS